MPARELLGEYARRLRERFGDRLDEMRLFGSFARAEAHEDSDVDVLVIVRDLVWAEKVEAVEIGAELSIASGILLSPVVMSRSDFDRLIALESAFAEDMLREGVRL